MCSRLLDHLYMQQLFAILIKAMTKGFSDPARESCLLVYTCLRLSKKKLKIKLASQVNQLRQHTVF